jgi:hypothetical protein
MVIYMKCGKNLNSLSGHLRACFEIVWGVEDSVYKHFESSGNLESNGKLL